MHSVPREAVGILRDRCDVEVECIKLRGREDDDQYGGHDEESHEAGLRCTGGGENHAEGAAVAVDADDEENCGWMLMFVD